MSILTFFAGLILGLLASAGCLDRRVRSLVKQGRFQFNGTDYAIREWVA